MASVNITSTKSGEIEKFLSKFYNTKIDLDDKYKWTHFYENPIEIAELIGIFIDNYDDYFFNMWVCLDKNIYINITENNANMIILGTSGSGKSTAAKLLLRSHFRNNSQVIMIDPEGELEDMARLYQGDFIDLGKGGEFGMINPLEVVLDADEEEAQNGLGYTVLTRTLQTIKAFLKYYSPDITEDVVNMFSEIVQETYQRFGINFNTDFTKLNSSDYPTFKDVYATIRGRLLSMTEKTHEKDILAQMEFEPILSPNLKLMDERIFKEEKMNIENEINS